MAQEHDVVVTIAGEDPALTDLIAVEIATHLSHLGVLHVTKSGEWPQVNSPAEGVVRLKKLIAVGKRDLTLLVDDAGGE